ncbi:MAG: hypothetical protein Q8K11_02015 [Phenylobacterium sp.]|uniref:hypothetical protein n=1 Tax=Phenylobacterium sp. TaxID=1871053 RepID=UPI00272FF636|nr:hypothetical protein [Phenylobacterium sp.]MDP2008929.1 hypothetical protein [Phenylobacterium sp.]
MSLTRDMEQGLERNGLIAHFDANKAAWEATTQDAYDYTKKAFNGQTVREDDVAKALRAAVEISPPLRTELDRKKLRQKYWIDHFTALVIDRTWAGLTK